MDEGFKGGKRGILLVNSAVKNSKKHNCRREYDPFVCLTAHSIFLIHVILLADFFEIVDILIRLYRG